MVSKSSAVRSIRLQNDLWTRLGAEAELRKTSLNGLVSDLLEVGLLRAAEARAKPVSVAPTKAAKSSAPAERAASSVSVTVPLAGTFKRPPMQKKGK